jgi:hypothetical protein
MKKRNQHCSNFPLLINSRVPNYICRTSKVSYLDDGKVSYVNLPTILANLQAIKSAMILANTWGSSTLSISDNAKEININVGITVRPTKLTGEVTVGKFITKYGKNIVNDPEWVLQEQNREVFHFFGLKDPYVYHGYPIISSDLECFLSHYKDSIDYLTLRLMESFGMAAEIGGVDANGEEAPILQTHQDEILKNWRDNRELLLPKGSKLMEHEISLSDFEKAMNPIERVISVETGIPLWLLFPTVVTGQYELVARNEWAQSVYESEVLPVLMKLLMIQGYEVINIDIPCYQGDLAKAEIKSLLSDANYKDSSTARNKQLTKNLIINPESSGRSMGRKL